MTSPSQESQAQVANQPQNSEKELNFRKQEAMYLRQLEQQRQETENLRKEFGGKTPDCILNEIYDCDCRA